MVEAWGLFLVCFHPALAGDWRVQVVLRVKGKKQQHRTLSVRRDM